MTSPVPLPIERLASFVSALINGFKGQAVTNPAAKAADPTLFADGLKDVPHHASSPDAVPKHDERADGSATSKVGTPARRDDAKRKRKDEKGLERSQHSPRGRLQRLLLAAAAMMFSVLVILAAASARVVAAKPTLTVGAAGVVCGPCIQQRQTGAAVSHMSRSSGKTTWAARRRPGRRRAGRARPRWR